MKGRIAYRAGKVARAARKERKAIAKDEARIAYDDFVSGGSGEMQNGGGDCEGRPAQEDSDDELWNDLFASQETVEWDRLQSIQNSALPFTRGQRPKSRRGRLIR